MERARREGKTGEQRGKKAKGGRKRKGGGSSRVSPNRKCTMAGYRRESPFQHPLMRKIEREEIVLMCT